jgi:hypothetical protein
MTDEERGFVQGMAIAVAIVARHHGLPTIAADVAATAGYTISDYVRAGVDEYDLKVLRKLRREERLFPRGRRSNAQRRR